MARFRPPVLFLSLAFLAPVAASPPNRTEVTALLFTPDGKTLITASLDDEVRFRDGRTGKLRGAVEAHLDGVYAASLSADGAVLATAGGDGRVRLWDVARMKEIRTLKGHQGAVAAVSLSSDRRWVASGGNDGTVRVWNATTGEAKHVLKGHADRVTSVAFAPDGGLLASAGMMPEQAFLGNRAEGDEVRLWDPGEGRLLRKLPLGGHGVAFGSAGRALLVFGTWLQFPPDKDGVHHVQDGPGLIVWDQDRERIKVKAYGAAALSPDGKLLTSGWKTRSRIVGGWDTSHEVAEGLCVWELATSKEVRSIRLPSIAAALAFSPDGARLAVGAKSGEVKLLALKPPSRDAANSVGISPETHWAALAGPAPAAYEATWLLADTKGTAFLKEHLKPAPPAGPRVKRLVADLDSDDFATREAASQALTKQLDEAEPELRQVLAGKPTPDLRRRVESLLEAIDPPRLSGERLRHSRALSALEWAGTKEARLVLEGLAKGAEGAWLTQDARAALARLARRSGR